jgi:hypothetical protein
MSKSKYLIDPPCWDPERCTRKRVLFGRLANGPETLPGLARPLSPENERSRYRRARLMGALLDWMPAARLASHIRPDGQAKKQLESPTYVASRCTLGTSRMKFWAVA